MYAHLPGSWSLAFWADRCPVLTLIPDIDDRKAQVRPSAEGGAKRKKGAA